MSKGLANTRVFGGFAYTLYAVFRAEQTPAINQKLQDALNLENEMKMTIARQNLIDAGYRVRKVKRSEQEYVLYYRDPRSTSDKAR